VATVGVWLVGDSEAADLCRELRAMQETHAAAQAAHAASSSGCSALTSQAVGLLTNRRRESATAQQLDAAAASLSDVESRLKELSK
jgi:hypothetical protein